MFKKVLVPLDGTELAEGILPYVTQLAKGMNLPITLLTVIDPDSVELPESYTRSKSAENGEFFRGIGPEVVLGGYAAVPSPIETPRERFAARRHETGGPYDIQVFESIEEQAKTALEKVAKKLEKQGLEAYPVVVFGNPAEEIAEVAEREGCDLIAMSTHGRNALGRGILGSVTDKVIHSVHIPTVTLTPDRAKDYWDGNEKISKVIVPLDGSPLSETVLPYVEQLAQTLSLDVVLVRTLRIGGAYGAFADGYPYAGSIDLEMEIEADAVNYLKEKSQALMTNGLKVTWRILKGAPAVSIVEFARETPQDLVVLATRGRSGVTRWVLGSVAEALIRASGDPVLVIPPN